jgi:hypothetical protein
MRDSCYLIISKNGVQDLRKTEYTLKPGQIAAKINLNLANSLFQQPQVEGTLRITDEDLPEGSIVKELEFELKQLKEKTE